LANIRQLQQHLETLSQSTTTSSSSNSSSSWPVIITFADGRAVCAPPEQCQELQQQLGVLSAGLQEQLQHWQQQHKTSAAAATAAAIGTGQVQPAMHQYRSAALDSRDRSSGGGSSSSMPVIDLGRFQGLPAMPTLNGFLLGYPAVYWVQSLQEAAAASKVLSMSHLKLHKVLGSCTAVKACSGDASGAGRVPCLMSFTVPESVCDGALECKVLQLLARLQGAAAGSDVCCDGAASATVQLREWAGIELSVEDVDCQQVSL
jgi:hypothetical protein